MSLLIFCYRYHKKMKKKMETGIIFYDNIIVYNIIYFIFIIIVIVIMF